MESTLKEKNNTKKHMQSSRKVNSLWFVQTNFIQNNEKNRIFEVFVYLLGSLKLAVYEADSMICVWIVRFFFSTDASVVTKQILGNFVSIYIWRYGVDD